MAMIAEVVLKSSEKKTEEYLRKRLEVEENIQSLEKSRTEIQCKFNNYKI